MSKFLKKMLRLKQEEVSKGMQSLPYKELIKRIRTESSIPGGFLSALAGGGAVIAEVKYSSPSKGNFQITHSIKELVVQYQNGGASAISVLTEPYYFNGSYEKLEMVRSSTHLPILQKDFIIHPWQIYRGRAAGASAVLLIAALLEDGHLQNLYHQAQQLGMDCLVEVHNGEELARLRRFSPKIIGVNNRNLNTLEVDLDTCMGLAQSLPKNALKIAESGITSSQDVQKIAAAGYHGILVGEALVSSSSPGTMIKEYQRQFKKSGDPL